MQISICSVNTFTCILFLKDISFLNICFARFSHWDEPSVLPGDYKGTVYKIVLMNGGVAEYEAILKSFYATEDNQEKKYAFCLGAASDIALKKR